MSTAAFDGRRGNAIDIDVAVGVFNVGGRSWLRLVLWLVIVVQLIFTCGPVAVEGRQAPWWGRTCCELSLVPRCQRSCQKVTRKWHLI
jgi:hypothetical protein